MKNKNRFICLFSLIICLLPGSTYLWAGTSGKIAGRITDAQSGEPLPFVNIIVEETTLGAATDLDGYYVILNVPPGIYSVTTQMMGYQGVKVTNTRVSIDFTTTLNFALKPTIIEVEGITVVAERPLIQMDLTSTRATVDAERIEQLPVEELDDLVNLQAGVVDGHIRGGRSSEVVYMLDGISITDPFSCELAVDVATNVVQELQVISGTFNAEYGQAMSGVVNIVTKEGGKNLSGRITTYTGDYVSNHTETFTNIDDINPLSIYNTEGTLGGPFPIFGKKFSFYVTTKRYYNEGYLYGQRIFNPNDSCDFKDENPAAWYIGATGDSAMVPMQLKGEYSLYGKLTYKISPNDKINYSLLWKNSVFRDYDHVYKYAPDGTYEQFAKGYVNTLNWTHVINPHTFFELKFGQSFHDYKKYVYEDAFDTRYVGSRGTGDTFRTGGNEFWHFYRNTTTYLGRVDLTSQVSKTHQIRLGAEVKTHKLYLHEFKLIPKKDETGNEIYPFEPAQPLITSTEHNKYTNYPFEAAVYIQDKMEFKNMIANVGIRFDYFDPYWKFPTDPRDPNPLSPIRERDPWFEDAKPKMQISPRVGIAYPITDRGVMHGSYGHFFQIPPFEYIYTDPEFEVYPLGLETRMGNAALEPQKTVIYEIGLQQQLSDNISLDVTGYFKNIRNLLGTKIYETYIMGRRYAQYINRDYGNVQGITVALEGRYSKYIYASLDYTYQIARGNASDPDAAFFDAMANRESEKWMVPFDWDQTHTLNGTITIGYPRFWGVSLIGRYGSGLPYTPTVQGARFAPENSERKPPHYNFDLRAYRNFNFSGFNCSIFLKVYNLMDRMNEVEVFTDTGRAGYTLQIYHIPVRHGISTLEDFFTRPDYYSKPRSIIIGFSVGF